MKQCKVFGLAKNWIGDDFEFKDHFICITSQIEKAKILDLMKLQQFNFPMK